MAGIRRLGVIVIGKRTVLAKTCTRCGHLRQGTQYRYHSKHEKLHLSVCKVCQHVSAKASDKRANLASQSGATKLWARWDGADEKKLKELIDAGMTNRQIAAELGRTVASITTRRHVLFGGK